MSADHSSANVELRRSFVLRVGAAAVGMISTFLLTVVVVRTLDSRDTAAFFAIMAALAIGPMIGRLGLGPNVVRLIPSAQDAHLKRRIASTHLLATVMLSLPSAPVVALAATAGLIGHGDFPAALLLTAVIVMIESIRLMLSDIFAAVGRVAASVATMHYIRSVMVLPVVGLVAVAIERPTLITLLSTYAAVAAGQLLFALIMARNNLVLPRFSEITALRAAVSASTKLFSMELTAFLLVSGTIWLANAAFTPVNATHYSAAATIAMQVTILESLAALAVTPPAARLWAAGRRDEVVDLLSNLATVNAVVTATVVVGLAVFGEWAMEFAYGPHMRDANVLLVVLAVGGVFQAAFAVNIALLIIGGHIDELARTAIGVLIVFLPAAIAAAFEGGPLALAIVSSLGIAALSIGEFLTARRVLHRAPHVHRNLLRAIRELVARESADATLPASPTHRTAA